MEQITEAKFKHIEGAIEGEHRWGKVVFTSSKVSHIKTKVVQQ